MNAKDEAWAKVDEATDSLVDMARLVDHDSLEDAYAELWTAVDAYAAAAVAEARAPLVEALEAAYRQITGYPSTEGGGVVSGYGQDKNNPLPRKIAAALAEETPDA